MNGLPQSVSASASAKLELNRLEICKAPPPLVGLNMQPKVLRHNPFNSGNDCLLCLPFVLIEETAENVELFLGISCLATLSNKESEFMWRNSDNIEIGIQHLNYTLTMAVLFYITVGI
jgi:hypothetical protein